MAEIPKLNFHECISADGQSHAIKLEGWEALNEWALNRDPAWYRAAHYAHHLKLSETDALKLLASTLLLKAKEMEVQLLDYLQMNGPLPNRILLQQG